MYKVYERRPIMHTEGYFGSTSSKIIVKIHPQQTNKRRVSLSERTKFFRSDSALVCQNLPLGGF